MEAKDVEVTIDDDVLTLRGQKRDEREDARGNYHHVERCWGSFARSLRLPAGVDATKV